ncbi:MAG TPA: DUF4129 domain-containing protein [Fibrobacteria bacterium]|nr:DUF4129 domain-containing protein [Fibrobacteria bacterium]
MTGTRASFPEPRALDTVEDAILLLKRVGPGAYGGYVAGTLGFLWALLYFWAYMSRNALAGARLAEFSLLLALAFAAMKFCHALFFRRLMLALEDAEPAPASPALLAKTALAQCLLQPLALLAVPLAFGLTLPYPFVSAFFQNACWVRDGEGFAAWLSRSYSMARVWPKQNMYLHLFLAGAGLCVAVNVFSALVAAPMLLKSLLGVDSVFTRTPSAYLNTTFVLMALALSWALLDPVVKAVNAWRCFHGLSLRSGMDLRLALARIRRKDAISGRMPAVLGLAALLGAVAPARGGPQTAPEANAVSRPAHALSPERLDALLKEEIAESRYGWRQPRHAEAEASQSWLLLQTKKLVHAIGRGIRKIESLWLRFRDWFNGVFGKAAREGEDRVPAPSSPLPTRILVAALCAAFLAGIGLFLLRRMRAVPERAEAPAAPLPAAPDAAREDAKADDFPEEEWLRLMESLRAAGQDRLALRALFLAMLSLLARKGWVTVARHKSNRDYQREVGARARRRPGVAESFRESCARFERVWYGLHPVTGEDWEVSRANFAEARRDEA